MQEVHDYGIKFWSNNEFKIEKGLVKVCHGKNPSLLEIVQSVLIRAIEAFVGAIPPFGAKTNQKPV